MPSTFWELRDKKVIVRSSKRENCLKRDLFNPTVKQTRDIAKRGWTYYPFFEVRDGEKIVRKIDG